MTTPGPATFDIALLERRQGFTLAVTFRTAARVVALFGPSGSGKTSVLQAIAGLNRRAVGHIAVAGRVLQDSRTQTFIKAHRRAVGTVFQDAQLFPHLSVRSNLLYGARIRRAEPIVTLSALVDLLAIGDLLGRRTRDLSGGEAQRVAIGRALLSAPAILLFDEPLASLDAARKDEVLPYVARLRGRFDLPFLYVSHDRAEVERIADTIVHLRDGRVTAIEDGVQGSSTKPSSSSP